MEPSRWTAAAQESAAVVTRSYPVIFRDAPHPLARFKIPAGCESASAMALEDEHKGVL